MDWRRLGERVRARRGALGLSRAELAELAGVDTATIGAIETEDRGRRAQTLGGLERALGWEEGSAYRVAKGGEPRLVVHVAAVPPPPDEPQLSVYVATLGEAVESIPPEKRDAAVRLAVEMFKQMGE